MPAHASQLLSRNMAAIVGLLVKDGQLVLDWDDEIVSGSCVTRKEVTA
jgi:NAD(P) transhydrogenase subunit alpha